MGLKTHLSFASTSPQSPGAFHRPLLSLSPPPSPLLPNWPPSLPPALRDLFEEKLPFTEYLRGSRKDIGLGVSLGAESRPHSIASLNLGSQLNVEMMTPAFRVVVGLKGGVKV